MIKTSRPSKIEQQAIKQPTTTWKEQQTTTIKKINRHHTTNNDIEKKLTTNIDLINNWTMTPTATICIFLKSFRSQTTTILTTDGPQA